MKLFTHPFQLALWAASIWVLGSCGNSTIPDDYHPGIGVPRLSLSNNQTIAFMDASTETFVLTNTGSDTAHNLSASSLSGPFSYYTMNLRDRTAGVFPGAGGTCRDDLRAGESCTIVIRYWPGNEGIHTTNLTITFYSGDIPSPRSISFSILGTSDNPET
jgi:hypothetical protein